MRIVVQSFISPELAHKLISLISQNALRNQAEWSSLSLSISREKAVAEYMSYRGNEQFLELVPKLTSDDPMFMEIERYQLKFEYSGSRYGLPGVDGRVIFGIKFLPPTPTLPENKLFLDILGEKVETEIKEYETTTPPEWKMKWYEMVLYNNRFKEKPIAAISMFELLKHGIDVQPLEFSRLPPELQIKARPLSPLVLQLLRM